MAPDLDRGFTLFELLATMALMSILLGIGLGAMSRPVPDPLIAANQVRDAVRRAQSFSMAEQSSSFVIFEPGNDDAIDFTPSRIQTGGLRIVAQWHFEEPGLKGFPHAATLVGGEVVPGGVIGNAVRLSAEKNSYLRLGSPSSFEALDGLLVELFVKPDDNDARTLVQKGDAYVLRQKSGGSLEFTISLPKEGELDRPDGEGRFVTMETDPDCLKIGLFNQVVATFDGWTMQITVDGRIKKRFTLPKRSRMLPRQGVAVTIGEADRPFAGVIDEVRLGTYVVEEGAPLPNSVQLDGKRQVVQFAPGGVLDPRRHDDFVEVVLRWGSENRKRSMYIDLLGDIQ